MVKNDNPFITDEQSEKENTYELMNDDEKLSYCESELKEAEKNKNYPIIRDLEIKIKKLSEDEDEKEEVFGLDTEKRVRVYVLSRNWHFDTNNKDDATLHGISKEDWRALILDEYKAMADSKAVDWLMVKFHDKDKPSEDDLKKAEQTINEDGLVELHVHAVVRYNSGKTQSAVSKDFLNNNQRRDNCKYIDNQKGGIRGACLYLTHHTQGCYNDEKTPYSFDDVIEFGALYKDLIKTAGADVRKKEDIEKDLDLLMERVFDGEIRIEQAKNEFRDKHGAYQLVKYKSFFDNGWSEYLEQLNQKYTRMSDNGDFVKTTTYIEGDSQTGKSVLGSQMNYVKFGDFNSFPVAGGNSDKITFDLVDGHKAEKGAVISDISPKMLSLSALKRWLEVGSFSLMQSRTTVKGFYSTSIYFANAISLFDYISEVISIDIHGANSYTKYLFNNKESMSEVKQLLRRFKYNHIYGTDSNGDKVLHVYELKNDLLSSDELYHEFLKAGKNIIDSSILEYFYNYLGHLKYDSTIEDERPFLLERRRLAEELIKVLDGKTNVNGFTKAEDIIIIEQDAVENEDLDDNNLQVNNDNSDRFNQLFS